MENGPESDTRTRTAPGARGLVSAEMPDQCLYCPLGKRVTPNLQQRLCP